MRIPHKLSARMPSFQGSALERPACEALPRGSVEREAEPQRQCVPRQSLGTSGKSGPHLLVCELDEWLGFPKILFVSERELKVACAVVADAGYIPRYAHWTLRSLRIQF